MKQFSFEDQQPEPESPPKEDGKKNEKKFKGEWSMKKKLLVGSLVLGVGGQVLDMIDSAVSRKNEDQDTNTASTGEKTFVAKLESENIPQDEQMYVEGSLEIEEHKDSITLTVEVQPGRHVHKTMNSKHALPVYKVTIKDIPKPVRDIRSVAKSVRVPISRLDKDHKGDSIELNFSDICKVSIETSDGGKTFEGSWWVLHENEKGNHQFSSSYVRPKAERMR